MKKLSAVLVVVVLGVTLAGALGASAYTCGQNDYSPADDFGNCESKQNHVECRGGTNIMAGKVYATEKGVQGCADHNGSFPIDGRVGLSVACRCVYVDGDESNVGYPYINGWGRVDADGYHCNQAGQQSYNSPGSDRGTMECLPVRPG